MKGIANKYKQTMQNHVPERRRIGRPRRVKRKENTPRTSSIEI